MPNFPTNGDYVQALQNPNLCFHDQELKAGRVELTPLGMPKAISGNFASVFSITGSSGKRYAIKCFTQQVGGQHQRYQAIYAALNTMAKPWQVGFDYIKQGVLVDGQWHAILRMEWVENSQTLIPWLQQNLGHPDRILDVAGQFASCVDDMHRAGIAHGDLQHGNLLVDANNKLRVIDYDGMFVPSIEDLGSKEIGLANYQHPLRTGGDFAAYLDRFSALLIYGSLLSLAAQPGLWLTFRNEGDEKLLLGKDDFVQPLDAIERLSLLGSPHTEFAAALSESLASATLQGVPEWDTSRISPPQHLHLVVQPTVAKANQSAWWQSAISDETGPTETSDREHASPIGAGWLRTHEAPLPPVEVEGPSRAAKVMGLIAAAALVLGAIATGAKLGALFGGLVLLIGAVTLVAAVWVRWRRSDAMVGRTAARNQSKLASRAVTQQQKLVSKVKGARTELNKEERRAIQKLEDERTKLTQSSTAEYERLSKDLRTQLTALQTTVSRLDLSKATEAQQQLKFLQNSHIQTYLSSRRIEPGVISGIGPAGVVSLAAHGIRTAGDIDAVSGSQFRTTGSLTWFTIYGIGPSKAFDIKYWLDRQVANANSGAPQSLPAQQKHALDTKYADQKRQHQAIIDAIDPQLRQIKTIVDAKYAALDQEISQNIDTVRLDYRRQQAAHDTAIRQAGRQLQILENALVDARRNLASYQSVSLLKYLKA